LIGLEVFNQLSGKTLGVVVDVIPAGNDLLEVKLNQSAEQPDKPSEAVTKAGKKRRKSQPKSPKPAKVLIPFVKRLCQCRSQKMVAWKLRHHWFCWK